MSLLDVPIEDLFDKCERIGNVDSDAKDETKAERSVIL
jgi:hypothetical protein